MLGLTGSQEQDSDSLLSLAQSLHRYFRILELTLGVHSKNILSSCSMCCIICKRWHILNLGAFLQSDKIEKIEAYTQL